jgi:hypothetical protein
MMGLALQPGQSVHGHAVDSFLPHQRRSMNASVEVQIRELHKLPTTVLRARYFELFGEDSRSGNRQFLFRRVAWRMQALAEGDLPERARKRALELANDADLRVQYRNSLPNSCGGTDGPDPRLPAAGTILRRSFRNQNVEVKILEEGFEFAGRRYQSLSAIASKVAGSRWNGFAFFGLDRRKDLAE